MNLCCQNDERRDAVRRLEGWNGIDYVAVAADQLSLQVYFLGRLPAVFASDAPGVEEHLSIEGGERITDIHVIDADPVLSEDPELDDTLVVRLDKAGDLSTYTLRLRGIERVDPRYESAEFSFKTDCPSDLDCAEVCACEPPQFRSPDINYLAKDYASFRRLILDRLALLKPNWTERHVPDIGIALTELLAYEGDHLSYYQDAVATEAYLGTARQRVSVRRHARLVDYRLHEGCNARAYVVLEANSAVKLDPAAVSFITGLNNALPDQRTVLGWDDLGDAAESEYEVFEPCGRNSEIRIRPAHNAIKLYTWGRSECCLERGSTSATLIDSGLDLRPGDVLIFEEVRGPVTGLSADADPNHRHAVRLTRVERGIDVVVRTEGGEPTPYLAVEWHEADALPFPVCISAIGPAPKCARIDDISVARGNVVLVDHGRTRDSEDLGRVPVEFSESGCVCEGRPEDIRAIAGRFYPQLEKTPLTFAAPKVAGAPASRSRNQDPREALPRIRLSSQPSVSWEPRYDLISSAASDAHFAVEVDNEGIAHLRFGDGELGLMPAAGMSFAAVYRTGNGTQGNVGADSISRLVLKNQTLSGVSLTVRNPMPAVGGVDAEPLSEARLIAPMAFRKRIERAIIGSDYEELAERNEKVQRAAAELVWTGSWHEADVAVDPFGGERGDETLLSEVAMHLEPYRRIGHDLHVERATYVPVHLELDVCVEEGYLPAHVRDALLDTFSDRVLADGKRGFFHPDNVSFGEGLFLSVIIATAQAVSGVASVRVTQFHRLFHAPNHEIEDGILRLGVNEISLLANDPNYPERGRLVVNVRGGR